MPDLTQATASPSGMDVGDDADSPADRLPPTKHHPNEHKETQTFDESDYARIPPADLPVGLPSRFGDDHWGRTANPRHNNSVERPSDDDHTLIWKAPNTQP